MFWYLVPSRRTLPWDDHNKSLLSLTFQIFSPSFLQSSHSSPSCLSTVLPPKRWPPLYTCFMSVMHPEFKCVTVDLRVYFLNNFYLEVSKGLARVGFMAISNGWMDVTRHCVPFIPSNLYFISLSPEGHIQLGRQKVYKYTWNDREWHSMHTKVVVVVQ